MGAREAADDLQRAGALVDSILRGYLAPPSRLSVTEWAERHRRLSAKDSSEPGPYRVERTPYAREPQDALSPHSAVQEVVLMWGAQTSKTTILGNWIAATIDMAPGPVMIVQPTLDLAKRYSRQRLTPMIEESPVLRAKVRENRSRDEANTTLLKEFSGGFLALAGANSAAGLRSMPIRDIAMDEIDAYPLDVDAEGDPIALAEARQSTFPRRKRAKTSTPTTKGFSRIEDAFLASDRRYFHVPCPHCGERQRLEWGADKPFGLKWRTTDDGVPMPETAHYVCRECAAEIGEHHKPAMLAAGEWVPMRPERSARVRGYHLSTLYSPLGWFSWADLVREWARAREAQTNGDHSKMRAFVNTRLAETWEEQGDKVAHSDLARRAEDFSLGVVPMGGLMLVQGVDVQRDRLERRVWAFGRGEESWLVDREVIWGDPLLEESAEASPWRVLTERRRTPLRHASGATMLIEATAIDSGDGTTTQAVYHYCRTWANARVIAVKGGSTRGEQPLGKPSSVDVTWRGTTLPRSLKLWIVGVDTIKHLLYGRLRLQQAGPGYVHLPRALAEGDEFEQLTAERLVVRYLRGKQRLEWVKPPGKRNESLDCGVYAYAAACWIGLQNMKDGGWSRREALYQPHLHDLFAAPIVDEPAVDPARITPLPASPAPSPRPVPTTSSSPSTPSTLRRDW